MFDLRRRAKAPRAAAPPRAAGLDIGERRTKIVVLEGPAARPRVVAWLDEPTPAGLVSSGRPARSPDVTAWVARILTRAGATGPLWSVCPSADAQVKRLTVADAGSRPATLRGLAVNPAFRTTGGEPGWRLDYHVVDAGSGAVMAAAARPEGVGAVARTIAETGVELTGITVVESAMVHAWRARTQDPEGRAVLVEAGHGGVTLVVVDSGEPVGFRRVMFGGRALEERGAAGPPEEVPPPLVEEWSARLGQEARMLVGAAFRSTGGPLPPLILMGGLGAVGELADGLARSLGGAPVWRWADRGEEHPAEVGAGEGAGCATAVAFGAALQGLHSLEAGTGGPAIQLLRDTDSARARPVRRAVAITRDRRVRMTGAVLGAAVLACAGTEAWLRSALREERSALAAGRADSARAAADIERLARLNDERGRLGGTAAVVERLRADAQTWPRLMDRLARAMPAYAWADSMSMDSAGPGVGVRFRLRGYAGAAGQVAALERALRGGPVRDAAVVALEPVPMAGLTLVRWTLVGTVRGDAGEESARSEQAQGPEGRR